MKASITFAAGQRSEISRYEVPREESLLFGVTPIFRSFHRTAS